MSSTAKPIGKALIWGGLTAALYWGLFQYAPDFLHLAHTTLDACKVVQDGAVVYLNKANAEACAQRGGTFISGTWWFVFAPIALAFAVSYTHGLFTSLFWEIAGLRAKK
jgi:hypothetical protein